MALGLTPQEIVDKKEYQLLTKASHWERVSLSDVASVQNGFAFKSKYFDRYLGIPLIRIRDITKDCTEHRYTGEYEASFVVQKGDILIGMDGDFTAARWQGPDALLNQRVCRVSLTTYHFDEKFFFICLQPYLKAINAETSSVTVKHLSSKSVGDIPLPLPSLNEQKRIVAKIEELFSELDNGIAALKTAREQLKVYRQAVLKHTFEGKLTAKWREENKDKLETPEQLLARIQQEREARYQQQMDDWKQAVKEWEENGKEGKKPGKPRTLSFPELPCVDDLDVSNIPNEWFWIHPGHLVSPEPYSIGIGPFGSNLKVVDYRESGVPLIFVRNITRKNYVDDLKYVDFEKAAELHAHQVHPLDLVITKMGDPPGDCDIYPETEPTAVLTADCLKFRVFEDYADRYFYKHCINSNFIKKQLGLITKGVAQKKISVDRFKTLVLPYPPFEEQRVIAGLIERAFETIEKTEKDIESQLLKAETLRQSILKKAFSGQLVPQDPNDEPARELLARIKAEKGAEQEKAKNTKKKPAVKRTRKGSKKVEGAAV
ncbi:restriction endonuclease subunit S [Endozoicomonas sp. SM1973]|uniref:Restriction endonuclease subunit S n=1 Tax=Spartinivicinus marinus TaxID=2994442 RepID=A0A853I5Y6_9GAMM|nr:restriction endonuclease subunit S [Spartinivicinus marinus]MCX4026801.1 restriction endonuclease subunit S [Spartinivicinus marinus]NYZ64635.1 restriction endonuclease subunit S [Spartinivicinus marinus]